ncbi:apolipoprotein N-acyltransferase [Pseudoalteromonas fenneropenaei]|uniref:Apolipoprotein N-acyltransferase n=1 Tax=Pseudoalteromonas fenneropenaei TaxID=1737459 RepID=A0ABV7CGT1_9GAMM
MATIPLTKFLRSLRDRHLWAALLGGGLLTFAYAPFNLWPLLFVGLGLACYATDQNHWRQVAKYGFAFGFAWFAAGISWVHVSIAEFGGLPLVVSLALMALLCGYLALFPALAFTLAHILSSGPITRLLALVVSFALTEWLRGTLLTGFPWLSFGYTQTDAPLNLLAPWIGEFGLTLLCVLLAGAFYLCLTQKRWLPTCLLASLIGIGLLLAQHSPSAEYSGKKIKALLVQGNIQQSLRWEPEHFWPTMQKYRDMTRVKWQQADLVVWPEAAVPELEEVAGPFLESLDNAAVFNNTALVTGIPDYQFDTRRVYNTLIVVGKRQAEDTSGQYTYLHRNRYQKHQLLPIGEFVPFEDWLRPIAPLFNLAMSSFTRGEAQQANLLANGLHLLPAICYEIAFAELVRGNFQADSDILFTVSNDAWFGHSHGPHQHMQIARMRALELQRPLIRVTNNGISGVYDPLTQTQLTIPQFSADTLLAEVKLINGYSFYSQHGTTPIWLAMVLLSVSLLTLRVYQLRYRAKPNQLTS